MRGFKGTFVHDWILLFSDRVNILVSIVPSLVYIMLFSTSISQLIPAIEYQGKLVPYPEFIFSGVIFTVVISSSVQVANSLFSEKSSGIGLEIWSLPTTAAGYFLGKAACAILYLLIQLVPMIVIGAFTLHVKATFAAWVGYTLAALLTSLALAACGSVLALAMTDMRRFLIILNILQPILIFSSPVFYRFVDIPQSLRWIAVVNPLTYGLDLARHQLIFNSPSLAPLILLLLILIVFSIIAGRLMQTMRNNL